MTAEGDPGYMTKPEDHVQDAGHPPPATPWWRRWGRTPREEPGFVPADGSYRAKSTMGILSDKETDQVPGKCPFSRLGLGPNLGLEKIT